ncbi:MAG: DmsC/YnfH family molybdoenzyme membrane anchor subunit [Burkholderiaceae bacterium]
MKPAWSVIFFTVSSGAGLGLMFWLALARMFHAAAPSNTWWWSLGLAVVLFVAGLLSSTAHLANPKNAWRAFSRFGSSWLSREGVFAIALLVALAAWTLSLLQAGPGMQRLSGTLVMVLAFAVLFCTGKIYACLKTIPRWHNWQTVVAYPALGLFSGAVLLTALTPPAAAPVIRWLAIVALIIAAIAKLTLYRAHTTRKGLDGGDALQVQGGVPRLLDVGHTNPSFLTREFGFELSEHAARWRRRLVVLLCFIEPAIVLVFVPDLAWLAVVSLVVGLFIERWLFFAEAQHVVRLYHGAQRV